MMLGLKRKPPRPSAVEIHHPNFQLARRLAWLMDSAFTVPGIRFKIGLDPLLGLIPVIGDIVPALISLYIVELSRQTRLPKDKLTLMYINVGIDTLISLIPVLGDLSDTVWKANFRNLRILEQHLQANPHLQIREEDLLEPDGDLTFTSSDPSKPSNQVIDVVVSPHPGDKS